LLTVIGLAIELPEGSDAPWNNGSEGADEKHFDLARARHCFGMAFVMPADFLNELLEGHRTLQIETEKDRSAKRSAERAAIQAKQQEEELRKVEERAHAKIQEDLRALQPSIVLPSAPEKVLARFPSTSDFPLATGHWPLALAFNIQGDMPSEPTPWLF
jgi:hypothetical protein